eukprot:3815087-Pleurochrysis_carterae.AAC.2
MAKGTYIPSYCTRHVATHCRPHARAMTSPASAAAAEMFNPPTNPRNIAYSETQDGRTGGQTQEGQKARGRQAPRSPRRGWGFSVGATSPTALHRPCREVCTCTL